MNTTSNTGFKHAKSAETIVLNPGTIDSDFKAHEKKIEIGLEILNLRDFLE